MENYLCVDIGGTSIKYAKFNQAGERVSALESCATPISDGANQIMPALIRIVEQEKMDVAGVCVASAGVVHPEKGKIIYAGYTIPGYTGTEIKKTIEHRFGLPCAVENDVNSACLGESWLGGARGRGSVLCLTIGTGIGGAMLINDKLINGYSFTACEVGYMQLSQGKFQDVASTKTLIKQVASRKNIDANALNGRQVMEWAYGDDAAVLAEIEQWIENLVEGVVNLIYIFNPEVIVLGGGLMEEEAFFKPRLEAAISAKLISPMFDTADLTFAKLGNEAGMIGALYHFLNQKEAKKDDNFK
ncbi:ROK family protein [Listeria cossartiae subsp. cayugensis]|uniref:ROK family protein n=1 Tax=Listeria cossartiae subsp. cayugensis TaxID=2713505 RepID=A0ABU2IRH8_9LIST|nr:ROK family protein [Listeria cossartiae]MDT0050245.1 ROK family protein [Listeria cossartiae subsp. cayugensis]MDT0066709.1 ROK family protein [Listeria cossartiae subsp. cayugensis]MDT0080636.1 ROK family protein [Listeria cossartiae subsp. cayugensis]MDT0082928.1 ROK family protein [Listeria cossartiae subsp. cayugensis]MDT0088980.1 ROK family protein [Listeria cossartiae subsp. cayugensis]